MLRRSLFVIASLVACGSEPPPPVVVVPPQPPQVEPPPPPPPPPPVAKPDTPSEPQESPLEGMLRDATKKTTCSSFDYHPNGGLQSLWCHRPPRLSVEAIAKNAGVGIFKSGPHSQTDLVTDARYDFGHYNPDFVKWLVEKVPPSPRDSPAQKLTQPAYDKHLKPLAEIFWKTLQKAKAEPDCFQREKTAYADLIAKKKLPESYHERWFYWMNPKYCAKAKTGLGPNDGFDYFSKNGFDGGVDGNVTKTVIGFWIRRSLDGTMDSLAEGLKKLLASYEPALLEQK
jgi:hypothetical protein